MQNNYNSRDKIANFFCRDFSNDQNYLCVTGYGVDRVLCGIYMFIGKGNVFPMRAWFATVSQTHQAMLWGCGSVSYRSVVYSPTTIKAAFIINQIAFFVHWFYSEHLLIMKKYVGAYYRNDVLFTMGILMCVTNVVGV